MSGGYDPKAVEAEIYQFWESGSYFHSEPDTTRKPFVITIPPPNVTGALHLGHALNNTLQDILIRRKRMQGYNACWLPGTDHAGIATQAVVEKRLKEEQNLSRHDVGREGLVQKIWDWKEEYNARILKQLRTMGCSCDWQRTRFTLDDQCAKAVYETFFRFFKDGLIYRGLRLVNWDAQLQTAVADDEIEHKTVKTNLWHIRYPILGAGTGERGNGGTGGAPAQIDAAAVEAAIRRATAPDAVLGRDYLIVATTRPETMLADTAVAVHPEDERFQALIGGMVVLPLMGRAIPIVADGMLVKREFGTGCVKVTPGHDPNDFACWQRKLGQPDEFAIIDLLTPDGKVNGNGGSYASMKKDDARKKVVADLEALGLLEKIEPYETEVGHSDRSKTPIEPLRSKQWFVKMEPDAVDLQRAAREGRNLPRLAESAMDAVRDGRVKFFPERYAKTFLDWLGEKRDWCISRQLWWGHRIPVWTGLFSNKHLKPQQVDLIDANIEACFSALKERVARLEKLTSTRGGFEVLPINDQPGWFQVCANNSVAQNALRAIEIDGSEWPGVSDAGEFDRLLNDFRDLVSQFTQDPDVLDTWFSSALWPHSTFGWPAGEAIQNPKSKIQNLASDTEVQRRDLDYFYPTSVLSTAREIITLWVARMVMTGLYNTGRVPFQHVYIHAVIQDGQGKRMSKSAGNGVDPLDIIDVYGADALRFTLAQLASETQDIRMPVKPAQLADGRTVNTSERFELGRNFANKVYQAATGFVLPNIEAAATAGHALQPRPLTFSDMAIEDRWILSRLAATIEEVDRRLEKYQFNEYANAVYSFFWSDFCDWYVEFIKPGLYGRDAAGASVTHFDDSSNVARQVLAWVLDQSLRLLHPVMPFVTEHLWHKLSAIAPKRGIGTLHVPNAALIAAHWPTTDEWPREPDLEKEIAPLQDVIRALREVRTSLNAIRSQAKQPALKTLPRAAIRCEAAIAEKLEKRYAVLERLGTVDAVSISPDTRKPAHSMSRILTGIEVFVPIAGLADLDIERKRLAKERDEAASAIERLNAKLSNEGFVAKAKPEVIAAERARHAELTERITTIARNLAELAE